MTDQLGVSGSQTHALFVRLDQQPFVGTQRAQPHQRDIGGEIGRADGHARAGLVRQPAEDEAHDEGSPTRREAQRKVADAQGELAFERLRRQRQHDAAQAARRLGMGTPAALLRRVHQRQRLRGNGGDIAPFAAQARIGLVEYFEHRVLQVALHGGVNAPPPCGAAPP